jgi:uncharacterized membrane protein
MHRLLVIPAAALLSVACFSSPPPSGDNEDAQAPVVETKSGSSETTVRAYDCEGGLYVVAEFRPATDDVWLFLPDMSGSLPHVRSASGAKYDDGATTFWTKGHEAMLDTGDGVDRSCVENRRRSIVESAKLRGNDYWATGNEPGWNLEVGPETIVFVTDYGQSRLEFPTPEPVADPASRVTTWSSSAQGHELILTVRGEQCADTMSDETFESRVEVRLDDRVYAGCGQALH